MSKEYENIKTKAISSFIWKFSERMLAQIVSFIVSIVLARILVPEDYGAVALVTIFVSLADILISNGLGAALIQKKDEDEVAFNTLFYAGIVLSLILYTILYVCAPIVARIYKNGQIVSVLRIMGIRILIGAVNVIQHAYVSKKLDFKKFFYSTCFGTIISGVVGILMALEGFGVWALVMQYLTNTIIDTIVLSFIIEWRPKLVFSFEKLKELLSFGCKLMLTGFFGVFFNQLKSLLIGAKYSSTDLAYFNRGERIPTLISNNIESTINSVLFPTLSAIQNENEKIVSGIRRFIKVGSFIIMPLMVGLAVTGDTVIILLLTEKWIMAVPYLQIICIQQMFTILNTANLQVLKAKGLGTTLVKLEFIKKPILLAILLITLQIGPMAIIKGVTMYEIIAAMINAFPAKRLLNYGIWLQIKDIFPNMLITAIMGIVVFFIGKIEIDIIWLFFLQVCVGGMVYILLSIVFKNENFYYIISLVNKNRVAS